MSEPQDPKPENGWFIDRLKALHKEADEIRQDAVKNKSIPEIATWTAVSAFLLLAIQIYRV
jgi:hypothetical protein